MSEAKVVKAVKFKTFGEKLEALLKEPCTKGGDHVGEDAGDELSCAGCIALEALHAMSKTAGVAIIAIKLGFPELYDKVSPKPSKV